MKYYLINNTIKKGSEMPTQNEWNTYFVYKHEYNNWLSSLQPCEIVYSELQKIISYKPLSVLNTSNPIDITDIVEEKDGKIYFKQPTEKQVESEYEAVEFYKWTATLTPTSNENCFNKIRDGYYRIKPPMELYEIFKNR